ncbi:hypothetical protein [Engelhardtia mirabilis]|uniref:DUF420 domain-containing protein n=1 Tax=Engelhardtia mirabilis TaxID=2528011 RepID=A0A518BH65_9BACT|nr:hypothetical protein Pla133_13860 [Planctomycetes bacterium Pla133]QDV00643.1 hypothetical protein Pla86_13850 [Planctomycetes bacterium Pla86]
MLSPTAGFLSFLGLTVVLLVFVTWTGLLGRRALHIPLVVTTVLSLGAAIYYAKQLGTLYDIESAGLITPVHLTLAKVTTALYLAPLATGIATLRGADVKRWHRLTAFTVLGLTLITTITGAWMILASTPL